MSFTSYWAANAVGDRMVTTGQDGRYRVTVKAGEADARARAYGFAEAIKKVNSPTGPPAPSTFHWSGCR